jgi:NhaA family Na+:H+ antiporter
VAGGTGPTGPGVRFIRPLRDFLAAEATGGAVLLVAAAAALVWANSPWKASYNDLWTTRLSIGLGDHVIALDLRNWVNEGLMTVFFFVVGLEIKRELVEGELRQPRQAALPAIAALGGMVVPAALYALINVGGEGGRGWAIPMSTDIAIAVGVLSLLGRRASPGLKLFVLARAIVDDIGTILVIALFFTGALDGVALEIALLLLAAMVVLRWAGVHVIGVFVVLGVGVWLAVHESGVHPTIAGVVLGLLTPAEPRTPHELVDVDRLADVSTVSAARETVAIARQSVSVLEWLEHVLHPWSSLVIVPLFALANAGISITSDTVRHAVGSTVTGGVVVGLVVGKLVGVLAATWAAVRLGAGVLPKDVSGRGLVAGAALGGIGFTVSIFVASLAFTDARLVEEAKLGILVASVASAAVGGAILWRNQPG